MSTVIDRFNRANGALGNADTGQAWTAAQWTIGGNTIRKTAGANGWAGAEATVDCGNADAQVEATCAGAPDYVGVVLRDNGSGRNYLIMCLPNSLNLYVATTANSYSALTSAVTAPIAVGTRIAARITGLRIRALVNNALAINYLSAYYGGSLTTSTRHGVTGNVQAVGSSMWDDVAIKVPVKVHDGIAWVNRWAKVWDGTAWVTRSARRWDGSAWR